ncbi:MAG: dTDP-4-dehydrorhamnose reductase [Planctomycetes bacterium]|nr:dTDP-4-dehydrorhamnose reductase [Planctomycetota bacterium]
MQKAVVVGAGGGLGKVLMARLPRFFETIGLTHRELDISRRNDVVACISEQRPDVIFNAAGLADVDACESDRWQAYLVNRDGTKHLSQASADAGALLVIPSSDLVFDGAKTTPYREEDSPNPLSIFGDTKLGAELAAMSQAPRHLIVRTGWLFGSQGRNYLTEILEKRETDEIIFGFDDQRCQPTYQVDFVDAVIELVKQNQTGVWHVASAGEASHYDFAKAVFETLGLPGDVVKPLRRGAGARSALRPRYSVLDCSKLQAAGVRMRPWIEALRDHLSTLARK